MLKKSWLILALITFFAFGQRFYQIQTNPPSLNWDEVSHGYNAYSILKTGADEWGARFPLIFKAFGDYKLPVYIYLTAIPVYFLGLTPIAVRLVSVLAGTLAIPAIYLLVVQLLNNKKIGLLAALLLAISPWHYFISRPALEANLALTLIIFGFWALLKALENPKFYLLSSILLGLSLHTYNVARVFVPLLLLAFFYIYRPKIRLKATYLIPIAILGLSLSMVVYQVFSGVGTARYSKLAILSDSAVYQLGQARSNSPLPPVLAKLRYNRPLYFVTKVTNYYLSYFSPKFIYQSQGAQYQFSIPGKNLFTLPVTILALIGGVWLLLSPRHSGLSRIFLFSWLLLSPVAAALTADPPQALRPNPLIPVIIIFASLGTYWIIDLFKKHRWAQKAVLVSIIFSCLVGYIRYLNSYHSTYPKTYSWSWQYGYQQAIEYVEKNSQNYNNVIFTKHYGEPHIFYAFFTKLNPLVIQPGGNNLRFEQSDWFWTDKINNIYFVNDWEIPKIIEDTMPLESGGEVSFKNSLLIVSPQSLPQNVTILKTINFLDGSPAFIIAIPK
ncbi:glycosyltransferase family 39 protein [Patescibacteria group bacterium]|nr:glycosyltransferase family 39 protein [Patescibacteria group bacterium]MBU1256810.1 glycosyltransferase family 39 protein [Patescibacteria group bacterium]MBU1457630.1 glycosyltransferase family 39 protein [Patescibacteria group bacterium]